MLRLVLSIRAVARALYGCYAWLALLVIVVPTCALLAVAPGVERRRSIARNASRLFFLVIGSPVRVEGSGLAAHYPCVVVANHASYLDGIILTAALPPGFTYLIKHQMATFPIAGFVLRRLGSAFVNRDDLLDRKRMARALVNLAVKGDALGFFPEGTFDAAPGLKPFQLGAFGAAVRARAAGRACHDLRGAAQAAGPPAAAGARAAARPDLRAGRSDAPIPTARGLMHATRRAMLVELDEPDLAPTEAPRDRVSAHSRERDPKELGSDPLL